MAFIKMATRFGTQSFYSNGQLIGLTCPVTSVKVV